jgi:hypothetical protein
MCYDRGDLENWELVTYIQGMGGAGKSTISKYILKQIYNPAQIADLDNKVEEQFGIGPLVLKHPYITIGDELDEKCQLDLTQFLKMVSGETISAAIKSKDPVFVEWPSHLWFSGNSLPPWEDKGGALSRRICSIYFNKSVRAIDKDMRLGDKIKEEMPNIIQKCVKAYLELVNKHSSHEFWSFCPAYFREAREQLRQISNILRSFMESDEIVFDPSGCILEKDFLTRFRLYAQGQNARVSPGSLRNKNFYFSSVLNEIKDSRGHDVRYERKSVVINDKRYDNAMCMFGFRFRNEDDPADVKEDADDHDVFVASTSSTVIPKRDSYRTDNSKGLLDIDSTTVVGDAQPKTSNRSDQAMKNINVSNGINAMNSIDLGSFSQLKEELKFESRSSPPKKNKPTLFDLNATETDDGDIGIVRTAATSRVARNIENSSRSTVKKASPKKSPKKSPKPSAAASDNSDEDSYDKIPSAKLVKRPTLLPPPDTKDLLADSEQQPNDDDIVELE